MCVGCVSAVMSALSAGVCARECVRTSGTCVISVVTALSAGVDGVWRSEAGSYECVCVACVYCVFVCTCMYVCLFVCLFGYECYVCMIIVVPAISAVWVECGGVMLGPVSLFVVFVCIVCFCCGNSCVCSLQVWVESEGVRRGPASVCRLRVCSYVCSLCRCVCVLVNVYVRVVRVCDISCACSLCRFGWSVEE